MAVVIPFFLMIISSSVNAFADLIKQFDAKEKVFMHRSDDSILHVLNARYNATASRLEVETREYTNKWVTVLPTDCLFTNSEEKVTPKKKKVSKKKETKVVESKPKFERAIGDGRVWL